MKKYKRIKNGILVCFGESRTIHDPDIEITPEEYDALDAAVKNKPEDTLELVYRMSAEGEYVGTARTRKETVRWYQMQVAGGMMLEDVPEEYRTDLPVPEPSAEYMAGYDQAVLDFTELEG